MKKLPRPRLTYANVVATLALFLALSGGAAYAASKIHFGDIAPSAVKTSNLHKRAITSGKLAIGAVRSNQIANGAVSAAQIGAGSVQPANLEVPLSFSATPTGGSAPVPTSGGPVPYPLTNAHWTQHPGEVDVTFGEAVVTLAYDGSGSGSCQAFIEFGLRGETEGGESGGGLSTSSTTPVQLEANVGAIPAMDPMAPASRRLTARIGSNGDCTEASTIDSTRFRVVAFG